MDPITMIRLGQIRQQELLDQAAGERERPALIQWSRLLEPIYAFVQRRARRSLRRAATAPVSASATAQIAFEECPCD